MSFDKNKIYRQDKREVFFYVGYIHNDTLWLQKINQNERNHILSQDILPGIFFMN